MPSEASETPFPITGRCYCGAHRFLGAARPESVTYCHCTDCRRVTGAPVAAFAAFDDATVTFQPGLDGGVSVTDGVRRWFCRRCGSPLAATYAYLPGQTYVAVGLLDQAHSLPPDRHAHADCALPWLHIDDGLPRDAASARDALTQARPT